MSDYRDPNDPMYRYEPADRTGMSWGWIAGAVFLVIVLAGGPLAWDMSQPVSHRITPRPRRRQHRRRPLRCPA